MASVPNLSAPNHQFDETKQYKKVVFQQGKPILDVDLNDMSDAILSQTTSALAEKMGFGPAQIDYRDWALLNVEHSLPSSPRNIDNFAFSLGRIDTLKGVIDTKNLSADGLERKIIFDYQSIIENNAQDPADRPFANYILKGQVTAISDGNFITDEHKLFSQDMGLLARDFNRVISSATGSSQVNSNIVKASSSFGVKIQEGACRVVFTSGAAAGESSAIASISNGGKSLILSTTVTPPNIGDDYVIIPDNTLNSYRSLYDATSSQQDSYHEGLTKLPKLVTYLQAFEEYVSSDEDVEIRSSALGQETTQRTQLRWCVRVAKVFMSVTGDTLDSTNVSELQLSHVFSELVGSKIDYQSMLDSASATDESQISQYWRGVDISGSLVSPLMGEMPSALGIEGVTPLHFFASKEAQSDRLIWSFLKSVILRSLDGLNGFNDLQVLNLHYSESKTSNNASNETLHPYFYLGLKTDNTATNIIHARLGVKGLFTAVDNGSVSAVYKAPMRVLVTQGDLSEDNMLSRSLSGINGVLYGQSAPLVFPSVASHLSFIDQSLLGLLGLGALGVDGEGIRVPSAIDYTPDGASTSIAQAGYGTGSIKPIDLLAPISGIDGFVDGAESYRLREKGSRPSHTVHFADEDLGWSLHIKEGNELQGSDGTDLSLRSWHQGLAQKTAFINGLNFRKLAIKTTAHKSADLFTISAPPVSSNFSSAPATPMLVNAYKTDGSSISLESYAASAVSIDSNNTYFNSTWNRPSGYGLDRLPPSSLLLQYWDSDGTRDVSSADWSDRDINDLGYGLWNRFNVTEAGNQYSFDPASHPSDLWANRATSMRLRYHVGDFYPGDADSRGVPTNQLIDSLNLFVRIEPLSLTHWMTMPKHQHSILENSLVMAEGIEALLKVSHGLGDTQKLINVSGNPLITSTSPYLTDGRFPHKDNLNEYGTEGNVDPFDLPFAHENHPFIHWYHPAQNELQMPAPNSNTTLGQNYTNSNGDLFKVTVYPKFGRRSLVIPALVPFTMREHDADLQHDTHDNHSIPIFSYTETGVTVPSYPDQITSDELPMGIDPDLSGGGSNDADDGVLPYVPYASKTSAGGTYTYTYPDNTTEAFRINQITFPTLFDSSNDDEVVGPVFLPASRKYLNSDGDASSPALGFNKLLKTNPDSIWQYVSSEEDANFPYDERNEYYYSEEGADGQALPAGLSANFNAWSVPVMRAPLRTRTVAAIVNLVRTSFETGLDDSILSSDYNFTMPSETWNATTRRGNQTPGIGPDVPSDTLFVGDSGTAIGGYSERTSFASPLSLGVGALHVEGGLLHNSWTGQNVIRDSFEAAWYYASNENSTQPVLNTFWALRNQGLQQKLLFNCSFRILHHRPSGRDSADGSSTMPKSLTEMFLVHDRTNNNAVKALIKDTSTANAKPYIHLASMHPASSGVNTQSPHPNYNKMSHLYSMVSDSIGGSADPSTYTSSNNMVEYNFENATTQTTAMGDTFTVDPYDYMSISSGSPNTPVRSYENAHNNSGIEVELISELNAIHADPTTRGLDIAGGDFELIDTLPTANELTLPGDHEIVFVLYTGHFGANLFDDPNTPTVDVTNTPAVAGCHLTATLEINRPSERVSSTATDERHYGVTSEGNPIKVYSIPSST